jgi:hypothetical protein
LRTLFPSGKIRCRKDKIDPWRKLFRNIGQANIKMIGRQISNGFEAMNEALKQKAEADS